MHTFVTHLHQNRLYSAKGGILHYLSRLPNCQTSSRRCHGSHCNNPLRWWFSWSLLLVRCLTTSACNYPLEKETHEHNLQPKTKQSPFFMGKKMKLPPCAVFECDIYIVTQSSSSRGHIWTGWTVAYVFTKFKAETITGENAKLHEDNQFWC